MVYLIRIVTHFVKLNDVRVSNFLEDLDFPGDSFDVLLVIDFLFLKNFYGDLRQLLNQQVNNAQNGIITHDI